MVGRVQPIALMVALQAGQTDRVRPRADRSRPWYRVKMSESRETRLTGPAPPHVGPVGTLMYGWKCAPATKENCELAHVAAGAATALSCPGTGWGSSKQAPQAGPAGHTVPASCGQEPQKARPRLAWPGERCSPVMGWPGACGKAHSFCAHAQQPCRGPWQVMVYREEGCAHCGDQESSMFRPSQTVPDRWVPQSWLLAH